MATKKDTAADFSPELGKTIMRLRQSYDLTLGQLAEKSGVAKSIISQIERNETNPTLGTIWRLSQALDTSIEEVLRSEERPALIEKATGAQVPVLNSEDGKFCLRITGWSNVVDWVQVYEIEAQPGGVLDSEPHAPGSVENLTIYKGKLRVTSGEDSFTGVGGDTLRYRCDLPHKIESLGEEPSHANMVLLMKGAVLK